MSDGYLPGYLAGQDAERERIIKLLEADGADCECHDCYLDKADQHWRFAIELIEGQK